MRRAALLAGLLLVALPAPASAFWTGGGTGTGTGAVSTLDPATITAPATSTGTTTLTFSGQAAVHDATSASPVTYVVQRALGAGSFTAVASGPCSGTLTKPVTSCADTVTASASYSYRVVASYATWTATSNTVTTTVTADTTPPTVSSMTQTDADPTKATTVRWTVTFSEPVTGVDATDFALTATGTVSGQSITSATGSGTTWTVTANTGSGEGKLGLKLVDNDTIVDGVGNKLGGTGAGNGNSAGPAYTLDRTAPTVSTVDLLDTNANGRVDEVVVTFSETLASSTATAPWTLANVPSGGTLTSVTTSGSVATLNLTEGGGAASTAVGTMTVALAATATGIRDSAGNQASFAAQVPRDKAGPALLSVTDTDVGSLLGGSDGLLQQGDSVTLKFSEPLLASSVATSPSVTEARGATGNATLSIPGITKLLDMNTTSYMSASSSATFAGTGTPSGSAVTVKVGGCSSATGLLGCVTPPTKAGTSTMTFTPSSAMTDTAGNGATGSAVFAGPLF